MPPSILPPTEVAETASLIQSAKVHANLQISTLKREEQRVLDKAMTREYANYLVALRRLHDDNDD